MSRRRGSGTYNRRTGLPRGAGSVEKLRSGRFQARPSKDRPSIGTFDTEQQAIDALAELWRRRDEAQPWSDETLESYIARFIALHKSRWQDGTLANYEWYAEAKINPSIGAIPVADIDRRVIEEWWVELTNATGMVRNGRESTGATTTAKVWKFLRQVLNKAYRDGITSHAPQDPVPSAATERAPERHLLTDAEFAAIVEHLPPNRRIVAVLAGLCGLRLGETLALRRQDIDFASATISVRQSLQEAGRKADRKLKATKTGAGTRTLPLDPTMLELVGAHLDSFVPDRSPTALVVATKSGTFLSQATWGDQWRRARAKAKLDTIFPSITVHDLRHYCLTNAAASTNQLREIMMYAGHSSTAAALRYQHAAATDLRHLARPLPSAVAEFVQPAQPSHHALAQTPNAIRVLRPGSTDTRTERSVSGDANPGARNR